MVFMTQGGIGREKGRIYLSTVKAVEDVDDGVLSKKYPFQVSSTLDISCHS